MSDFSAPDPHDELGHRARQAEEIARHPADYKVCEGCQSIVRRAAVLCPNCHSYRYDGRAERVRSQARQLGKRAGRSVTDEDLLS